jgi:uncharacterized caspase-like protein
MVMTGLVASGAAHAAPEQRVALIIGVGAYANVPHLANPANDARLIEQSLKTLGFDVETVIDPNRDQMARALSGFSRRGEGATIALFFHAGHGIQVSGRNYLLPTDAVVEHESDLRYNAFDVQDLLDQMDEPGRVNLVFLDACRDNPFARLLGARAGSRSVSVDRGLSRDERIGAAR